MIEKVRAYFALNGIPAGGLTPAVYISDTDDNLEVNGDAMSALTLTGFYVYDFATFDPSKDYVVICDGGATLVGSERYAIGGSGDTGSIAAIKAQTDDLPSGVPKNVALSNFEFLMVEAGNHILPAKGLTLTSEISKDGGAFAACTNDASEISDGVYKIDLTAAEMNADVVTLKVTNEKADQRTITIVTSA